MNNNLEQTKKSSKNLSHNKNPKAYSHKGLNGITSDVNPKETGSLNILSTGNDFYTGFSNDDISSICGINNITNDSITEEERAVNKNTPKK